MKKRNVVDLVSSGIVLLTLAQFLQLKQFLDSEQLLQALSWEFGHNESLVIIIGDIRGGEPAWESLYRNVLNPNKADLALMVGEVAPMKRTSSLYKRAKYVWEFPEYTDWGDAIDLIGSSQDGNFTWRDLASYQLEGSTVFGPAKPSTTGSGAINYMARWFVSNKIKELSLLNTYTRFVITRSDHFYLCRLQKLAKLDPQFVWMPRGEDYYGFQDRFMVLSKQNVLQALDIFPPIVQHPKKYARYFKPVKDGNISQQRLFNPEKLTKVVWEESGIAEKVRRMARAMLVVKQPTDTSRWSKPEFCFESPTHLNGTGIKYFSEYMFAVRFCKNESKLYSVFNCSEEHIGN